MVIHYSILAHTVRSMFIQTIISSRFDIMLNHNNNMWTVDRVWQICPTWKHIKQDHDDDDDDDAVY